MTAHRLFGERKVLVPRSAERDRRATPARSACRSPVGTVPAEMPKSLIGIVLWWKRPCQRQMIAFS